MRGAGGAVCVAIAALLVCCSADPHQESEVNGERTGDRYDSGHKAPASSQEHKDLVREARETVHDLIPYLASRHDYGSIGGAGAGSSHQAWQRGSAKYGGHYYVDRLPKRNFDEIDRSEMNTFSKRNFDEIDQTSMPFPFMSQAKRYYRPYNPHHYSIDMPQSSFDKKRFRLDYPMDEIDLSPFPIGSKRSSLYKKRYQPDYPMDEIDLSPFPIGSKRSSLYKKRYPQDYPMDEIDLSPFPIGSKRSSLLPKKRYPQDFPMDEIDLSPFPIGSKRWRPARQEFDEIDLSELPIGSDARPERSASDHHSAR